MVTSAKIVPDFSVDVINSMKKLTVHLRLLLSIIISQFVYHMIGFGICLNFKAVKQIWLSALNGKSYTLIRWKTLKQLQNGAHSFVKLHL